MILVIAEKPSVAQSIAKVLGATSRKDGYMEGGNYIVSWCFGHLVEQIECIVLSKRHAIAKPGIWMLIINFHNFPLFPARRHMIIL